MLSVVFSQLRYTWGRTIALLVVIAFATASFTLLTQVVEVSRLQVRGTVEANFRSSYDLLVRPTSSYTSRESEQGLVRPNYQSGIFGGITQANLDAIRSVRSVEVAAPVSNFGYVNVQGSVRIDLRPMLDDHVSQQLFRIRPTFTMDRGLTRFTGAALYVYVSRNPAVLEPQAGKGLAPVEERSSGGLGDVPAYVERVPGRAKPLPACVNYGLDQVEHQERRNPAFTPASTAIPFGYRDPYADTATTMSCFYLPTKIRQDDRYPGASDPSRLDAVIPVSLPVLLTAIDPVAENQISGLDQAVVSGRVLSAQDGPPPPMHQDNSQLTDLPVLASTSTSLDQQVTATIERVQSDAVQLTHTLADHRGLIERLGALPGTALRQTEPVDAQATWEEAASGRTAVEQGAPLMVGTYWQVGSSQYSDDRGDLRIDNVPNPPDRYISAGVNAPAPVGSDDAGVREVIGRSLFAGGQRYGQLQIVGRFDPRKVLGDQALSGLLSPTYETPLLSGADPATKSALAGRALAPSTNVAGYAAQPPALLTTLPAARFLLDSGSYGPPTIEPEVLGPGEERPDPISVVRVRVAGITGPDPVSRERLNQAAMDIERRTSLAVDIVAGTSGVPTTVVLPGGDHGRPELRLTENWARKNLAYTVISAVDRKSLALFVLILTVCALVVVNAASTAVQTRRVGLGVLSCLGWSAGRLFGLIMTELAVTGLVAGLLGAGTALLVSTTGGPDISWQGSLLAVPPAVLLAVLMGLVPAARAARATPVEAVKPLIRPSRRAVPVHTITQLGLSNLVRTPGRTALAASSLALGIAALAVLLVVHQAFRGLMIGSLLGDAVVLNIRSPDLIALVTIVGLGATAVLDAVYLSVREQTSEHAMLRSTGWTGMDLVRLVVVQGFGVGVLGSTSGALLGSLAVLTLTGSLGLDILSPLAIATAAGILLATLAALGPAALVCRLATITQLSQDES